MKIQDTLKTGTMRYPVENEDGRLSGNKGSRYRMKMEIQGNLETGTGYPMKSEDGRLSENKSSRYPSKYKIQKYPKPELL